MKKNLLFFFLASVFLFGPAGAAAQTWTAAGPDDSGVLTSTTADYPSMAYVGSVLYVAYWDGASSANMSVLGNLVVKRLNAAGTGWEPIGSPLFSASTAMRVLIAYKDNTPYIIYPGDATYPGGIKRLNSAGNGWETVAMNSTGLAGLQLTHTANIAFHDNTEYKVNVAADGLTLTLNRLNTDDTAWETVGPPLTAEGRAYTISLAFNGDIPYISYNASYTEGLKANVKRLNSATNTWETVGSQNFSTSQGAGISLIDNGLTLLFNNGDTYAALIPKPTRNTYGVPVLLKLNSAGTGWENVGSSADFTGVQAQYFDAAFNNNIPYLAYNDLTYGRISVKKLSASGANWETVGTPNFSGPAAIFPSLVFTGNIPNVVYTENNNVSSVRVKQLSASGTEWNTLGGGPGFTPSGFTFYNGSAYAVYQDADGKATVRRLNSGSVTWETVGNAGFSAGIVSQAKIYFDSGIPYVSYQDAANGNKATVMKLNGGSWQVVGNVGFTSPYPYNLSLAFNNGVPYAVFEDSNNSTKVTVMQLNSAGTGWQQVGGGGASDGPAVYPVLAFNGDTPYIAYADETVNGRLTVKKFDAGAGSWLNAGATGISAGAAQFISLVCNAGTVYAGYQDAANGSRINVLKLNAAGSWEGVGNPYFTTGGASYLSLSFNKDVLYAGFADDANGSKATVMKLNTATNTWGLVGNGDFSAGVVSKTALGFNGTTVYMMYASNDAYVKKFEDALNPEPQITDFTPKDATSATTVNIAGMGFTGATAVTFGGVPAASFSVGSANTITAVPGAGASGDVAVTTPGGTSVMPGFIYHKAPVITAFTPMATGANGLITITGSGFTGATAVAFGGVPAQSFTVTSDTSLTAVADTGATGALTVVTPYGNAAAPGFVFVHKPVITSDGPVTFASGGKVTLSTPQYTGYTYEWYQNGAAIANATTANYAATASGSYQVAVFVAGYSLLSDPVAVQVIFTLPADNFKISGTSLTCKDQKDGMINIAAVQPLNYTAALSGGDGASQTLAFTSAADFSGLAAGSYNVCITVAGQPDFKQCYDLTLTEPQDLSVYSSTDKAHNSLNLQLNGGSTYHIQVNGKAYETTGNFITVPLDAGSNTVAVTTDKLCQGIIQQIVNLTGNAAPYPNPFQDKLLVNFGEGSIAAASIDIYNIAGGKPALRTKYTNASGVQQLDVSALSNGIYTFRLVLDGRETEYKIVKQ